MGPDPQQVRAIVASIINCVEALDNGAPSLAVVPILLTRAVDLTRMADAIDNAPVVSDPAATMEGMQVHVDAKVVVHNYEGTSNDEVLAALDNLRSMLMSALTDQVTRVAAAYASIKALFEEALAADPGQEATIADLHARLDAAMAENATAAADLANIAPAPADVPVVPGDVVPPVV